MSLQPIPIRLTEVGHPRLGNLVIVLAISMNVALQHVLAEEMPPDVTPRSVYPPTSRDGPLIDVQIALRSEDSKDRQSSSSQTLDSLLAGHEPLEPLDEVNALESSRHEFWEGVDGWEVPHLRNGQAAKVDARFLHRLGVAYGSIIERATRGTSVPPSMVVAVMMVESAGRPTAVSRAGAVGLMQLMPATAARFRVSDRRDPEQSIRGGVEYLDWLLREFAGDPVLALAGYNAGENAVKRYGGVPPFSETQAYVPKVLAAWRTANGLCSGEVTVWSTCAFTENELASQKRL